MRETRGPTRKLQENLGGVIRDSTLGNFPDPHVAVIAGGGQHPGVIWVEHEIEDLTPVDKGGDLGWLPSHFGKGDDSNLTSGLVQGNGQKLGADLRIRNSQVKKIN